MRRVFVLAFVLLTVPSFASTRTWVVQSGNWSNPANWSPQGLPQPGETLEFRGTLQPIAMVNDLPPGTVVGPMLFLGEGSLTGNPLTLTGDLSFVSSPSAVPFTISTDLTLGASITIQHAIIKNFTGAIDVNGKTLTFDPAYSTTIRGPIRGTGTILINGTGLHIDSSGPFSGTIDGRVNIAGSYPNATVVSARFSGEGTVGPVHAGLLYPGDNDPRPSTGGDRVIGTLQTGSLAIDPAGAAENGGAHNSMPRGRLLFDINPAGASDLVQVRGTVSLDATLEIDLFSTPANGQSFTLIDNDGTDPVSGRFTGLSEGASFTVGTTTMWVTYRGGDGNDVVLNAGSPPPTAKTWTGATSANWSEPANWSPVGVPVSGDALLFPAGARLTTNNDLSGFIVGPMMFQDDYVLSGNAIALIGDLQFSGTSVDFTCSAPLSLRQSLKFQSAGSTTFLGPIDSGHHVLTLATKRTAIRGPISGTSEIVIEGEGLTVAGNGPFSGRFRGRLDITGEYPNATLDGWTGSLSGSGTFAAVAAMILSPGSTNPCCADSHAGGVIRTNWFSLNDDYRVDLHATGVSDQVIVTGPVALYGELEVTTHGALTAPAYTIIDNDGTDPVYEGFAGLPEGATFYAGDEKFGITYKGGDGNDVVLTRLTTPAKAATATALAQSAATSAVNEPVTFTATVTSSASVPTGTVTFTNGSALLGTATLQNGVAELTTSTLGEGSHSIVATYSGSEAFESSASAPVVHTVSKGSATVAIAALSSGLVHGDDASYRVDVSATSGTPDGSVTLRVDGNAAGTSALGAGSATFTVPSLAAGEHVIAATYEGNAQYGTATASITQTVAKAQTTASLESSANPSLPGASVDVTARVSVPDRPALAAEGTVVFRNNGQVVGEAPLGGGAATVRIGPLAAGDHEITATYGGGAGFEGSTATLTQRVVADETATSTTLTQNRATTEVNQPVTFTARVTAASGVPSGTVTFTDGDATLGSAALTNGVAELTTKALAEGNHDIVARYGGSDPFAASASAPLRHRVVRGNPHVALTLGATSLVHGDPATFRIDVSSKAGDGRVPAGRVTLRVDGTAAGSAALNAGSATITVPMLFAGEHTISATYEGNAEFALATASITRTVAKGTASVALETDADRAVAGEPIDVTVRVSSGRPTLPADGIVAVWHGRQFLGEAVLAGGVATANLGRFEAGEYDITAAYAGSAGFEAANGTLRLRVTEPVASVASQNFDEGNGLHEVAVQIQLTGSSPTPVVLEYRTIDGTAAAADDYEEARGTLTLAPGQSVATVPVRVIGDTQPEPDETFSIELTNPVGARIRASAPIVIRNDEPLHHPPVAYTYQSDNAELQATFYAPLEGSGPRPVILWVPGDEAYDSAGDDIAALRLTAHGYAVVAATYRPAGTAPFPAQVRDLEAAVRWLRANAATLNIDPNRVAAWGTGAGGHLAALLGAGFGGNAPDSRVQAVVTWGAIADPATLSDDALACGTIDWNAATSPAATLLGCSPRACSAPAEAAATAAHAGAGDAAMLVMHGANDCVVGPRQSQRLYEALQRAGVDATLKVLDGVGRDDAFWTSSDAFGEVRTFLDDQFSGARRRAVRR